MTAGTVLVLAYWAFFTIRKGFAPKLAKRQRANDFDRVVSKDEATKQAARRMRPVLSAASGTLRVIGWVETALLVLIAGWVLFLVGALITGTFVFFGYPV